MRWFFLAIDNTVSLTNAHHGRPVFFNLQTGRQEGDHICYTHRFSPPQAPLENIRKT